MHEVFASLFNDRAIAYRVHQGFDHSAVALSAGVQHMVRSDLGASGVMFTLDTDSGFRDVVFITASYGLGETVVQGAVNPDEFYVYKPALRAGKHADPAPQSRRQGHQDGVRGARAPASASQTVDVPAAERQRFSLSDADIVDARDARRCIIEEHYEQPDGHRVGQGRLDRRDLHPAGAPGDRAEPRGPHHPALRAQEHARRCWPTGRSIGQRIGAGPARVIRDVEEMARVQTGDVLVADMTDPDWEPVMKRAAAIVTNRGGRTCHAAIIARELGIPAVVGCGDATQRIREGQDSHGVLRRRRYRLRLRGHARVRAQADRARLAAADSGEDHDERRQSGARVRLRRHSASRRRARAPRVHHQSHDRRAPARAARIRPARRASCKEQIRAQIAGYADPVSFYVDKLAEGIAQIAAAFAPEPVIVRLSDFKSNEYANLIGGATYEPHEENPMLGFRGASRYVDETFRPCFELECRALQARARRDGPRPTCR